MNDQKLFPFILLLFLFCFSKLSAQIVVSPSTACAPAAVLLSGPAGATNQYWVLGTGMGTSTLSSVSALYTTPGTYNVTYSAIVAGNPVNYSAQILVKSVPTASFSYVLPSSHCAPMSVNFSASGSASSPVYTWAFGDLTALATGATITHIYTSGNNFIPIMTVMDGVTQCTSVASPVSGGTIHVSANATINITSSNGLTSCAPPFTTNLDASGSISGSPISGGGLSYNWNIQGGSPSSGFSANLGATTFGIGTNSIIVSVTDNNQCTTTTQTLVNVGANVLSATVPGTVCINKPVSATVSTSQGTVSFFSANSSYANPVNTVVIPNNTIVVDTVAIYTVPGITTMTIDVPVGPGCPALTLFKPIFVEQVTASIVASPPVTTCASLATITFVNLSSVNNSSSLTYNWTTNWVQNASHHGVPTATSLSTPSPVTFTFWQGSLNPYTTYTYFSPAIDLQVVSYPTGCISHLNLGGQFNMARPSAKFISSEKRGCLPLTVTFTSTSVFIPGTSLTSYTWSNGENPPVTVTGNVPLPPSPGANIIPPFASTYTAPGTYYPRLKITTTGGCVDSSYVDTVIVVDPPTNLTATISPSGPICAGTPVTITMSASPVPTLSSSWGNDHWHVTTDEQYFSGCFTNSSPTFSFTHLGVHDVSMYVSRVGCASTNTLSQTVLVTGPIGKFVHETNCDVNRKMVKFNVHLQETNTAVLNFGDGNQVTINGNISGSYATVITHTYANIGNYNVSLVSTNGSNGCGNYTFPKLVKVRDAKARITFKGHSLPVFPAPMGCVNDKIEFYGGTSTSADGCEGLYTWFFQSPAGTNPSVPAVTMTPISFQLTNAYFKKVFAGLLPPNNDSLWSYMVPALKDTFRVAGTYTIGMRIKDDNSCVDVSTEIFRISGPVVDYTITPNPVCHSDGTVQLTNFTDSHNVYGDVITKYTWDFGDGIPPATSTIGLSSLTHPVILNITPTVAPVATLTAENQIGCKSTGTLVWQVNNPFANFSPMTNTYVCIPKVGGGNLGFQANQGYATYSISYGDTPIPLWSVATGTFNNNMHNYTAPGSYVARLTVMDAAGCKDTDTMLIKAIGQPTASFFASDGKYRFCIPGYPKLESTSSINISPINGYAWTMATNVNTITSPTTSDTLFNNLILPATGIYTISLTVSSDGYCPSTSSKTLSASNPSATAILNPTMFCLGSSINAGVKVIGDDVYQWQWFFGDNVPQPPRLNLPATPTMVTYPYNIYPNATSTGAATVALSYRDKNNDCQRTIEFPIQVIKLESDFIHYINLYQHCLGVRDTFVNTTPNPLNLNLSYAWQFGDQTNGAGPKPPHLYANAGVYTVSMTAKDANYNCENTTVKNMTIFPLPVAHVAITPTMVCPTATFEVNGSGSPGVSGFLTGTLNPLNGNNSFDMAPSNSFVTTSSITAMTIYTLVVRDENGCVSKPAFDTIFVMPSTPVKNWDTSIVIGQTVPMNAFIGTGYTYTWTPLVLDLNCDTCLIPNPISSTMIDRTYTVMIEDPLRCSIVKSRFTIKVIPKVSVDVPTAFTPNGDGINDVIFPDGWGLKKLIYFKVFNRWGQLIFESNDLNVGWDGTYQGVPQNMETYVYQLSVETLVETQAVLNKTGTFKLIR